ncbi:hypothetical protein COCC4DRAFT_31313 [Bipolaris maydis ATCC 48331]|uniref:Uncharacterized protein n=2 Tax=Cochliobolus heterostrophus TaxID=5016 RepID=M2UHB3_COCH5|nr:uncharacterized protein COCC4DRAFT_31313 [Bipolaris maydis ATCC 48331]EMD87358.1 hypothetical protein COCHEDRAFT_1023508 [Bipolaris maydis C5]KAJ5023349.1 hypothetical protein J3E73DRAFT_339103 [Bipolaris maydis]ENI06556.1 hypothetical protein COCC4DRAFT_31313 [Bipolaris maydis ATCC 48331]KAJ5055898.1 hypothetical protein J3E74DRAFT_376235 [Bipolaris maydis]KAJ6193653.1 hypothetical protein J3E72DRAFT_351163 [Bipolaris maydis]
MRFFIADFSAFRAIAVVRVMFVFGSEIATAGLGWSDGRVIAAKIELWRGGACVLGILWLGIVG